ncbi:MAG TPA: class I SAM-dependent methyltransferase [Actinomycetes bacterium]|nr:class I SAM-dependent methyltransferase [Actinomycetes bacterium]
MTQSRLDAVYGATSSAELQKAYDEWAQSYDSDMADVGYRHPAVALALLTRYLASGEAPILDAGAGTGLVGELLAVMSYPDVDALDASQGMLDVAQSKGVYRELYQAFLGEALPLRTDSYAAVVSTGVFTAGHVGIEGLPELFRVVRPNGFVVLSVKLTVWDDGLADYLSDRERDGILRIREVTPQYASMPAGEETSPCVGVVAEVVGG